MRSLVLRSQHCLAPATGVELQVELQFRDNAFGTSYGHANKRASLDRGEAQTVSFSDSFCCFDVMDSK